MIIRALSLFQVSCNFCKLSLSSSEAEADNDVGGHSSVRGVEWIPDPIEWSTGLGWIRARS